MILKHVHISLGSLPGDTIKKLMCQKGKASSKVKVHYITILKVSLYSLINIFNFKNRYIHAAHFAMHKRVYTKIMIELLVTDKAYS